METLTRRHMGDDDDGGMSMGSMSMDSSSTCKVSMLWNWYTIDACFLSESWHIKNRGMFAASCIGIALLVVCLEGLRRLSTEFDSAMHRQWRAHAASVAAARNSAPQSSGQTPNLYHSDVAGVEGTCEEGCSGSAGTRTFSTSTITYRPTPLQQLIRALLHAVTFGLAYILMLLAMYYNGYIIISIILGAALGKFLCDWRSTTLPVTLASSLMSASGQDNKEGGGARRVGQDDASFKSDDLREPTVCCG